MNARHQTIISFLFLCSAIILCGVFTSAFAQTDPTATGDISPAVTSRRAELEKQLTALQADIDAQKKVLATKQTESVSMQRDIAILDAKIKSAKLNIKALDIRIGTLTDEIKQKEVAISGLSNKINKELQSLAQLLRNTRIIDAYSLPEVMMSDKDLSSFFEDIDSFQSIKIALGQSFNALRSTKKVTEVEKGSLEDAVAEQTDLKNIQVLEARRITQQEAEKNAILKVTKGLESAYKTLIKSNEQTAAQIRAELFSLSGSAAIPFEKAYEYAVQASKKTGVRPALILGIIAEESNLGENVGTGNWQVDMKAPRDTVPFLAICQELGLDPNKMPVSKKPWYGYGGAMGPAQFIPSTWVLYVDRISAVTGHTPPNPWNPEDAFTATAILMQDNGAAKGTYAAERLAALRYLAGWKNASNKSYAFYGDDVMDLAAKYQAQINILNQ